jgi:hypothetical protein
MLHDKHVVYCNKAEVSSMSESDRHPAFPYPLASLASTATATPPEPSGVLASVPKVPNVTNLVTGESLFDESSDSTPTGGTGWWGDDDPTSGYKGYSGSD